MPDFFIVGAPKAGTTTLYYWLSKHPDVFMPKDPVYKEPRFFCGIDADFSGPKCEVFNKSLVRSKSQYESLFSEAKPNSLKGEASVDYLLFSSAPSNIKTACPHAKIIIVLRNPIERAYSEHMHLVRDLWEDKSFEEALALEDERIKNRWQPLFWHKRRGLYFDAVVRYISTFGKQNVKIFFFEQFKNDTQKLMDELCDFLGIQQIKICKSEAYNASGQVKNLFVQKIIYSDFIDKFGKFVFKSNIDFPRKIKRILVEKNLKPAAKMSPETKEQLIKYYSVDIKKLQDFLGVDLSSWMV